MSTAARDFDRAPPNLLPRWVAAGVVVLAMALAAIPFSHSFGADRRLADMPIVPLVAALVAAATAALAIVALVRDAPSLTARDNTLILVWVFAVGLAARVAMLASEPVLEVDFNRYLLDGAMTANGNNPYLLAPREFSALPYNDPRLEIARNGGAIFDRISYPEYKSVYPAGAQAFFAAAHLIAPWSLAAWRMVLMAGEAVTFALLVALLGQVGRSPLLVALYWWHPLPIKEIANSAHMEGVLTPLMLAALLASARGRHVAAAAVLGLAATVKLWPVMLVPLVLRPLLPEPGRLALAGGLVAMMLLGASAPVLLGGLDASSGFVAFATHWSTNSALFPMLEAGMRMVVGPVSDDPLLPGRLTRGVSALAVGGLAIWLSARPIESGADLVRRAYLVVSMLVLISPAQFPWYLIWVLPLATVAGGLVWWIAAALAPLYYLSFWLHGVGAYDRWAFPLALVQWAPVWVVLAWRFWRERPGAKAQP